MRTRIPSFAVFALTVLAPLSTALAVDNVVHVGAAYADPGEIHIGYRLMITGDENLNAACQVRFRKLGDTTWRPALNGWRFHPWVTPSEDGTGGTNNVIDRAENRFAGSVFWVEPGETYEIELTLTDPDGVDGTNPVILTTTTWTELVPNPSGRKLYVIPGSGGGTGTIDDPFRGLPAAHAAAQAGDIFYIGSGTYPGFTITKNGTPGNPICWIGPPDRSAILDGGGSGRALQLGDTSNPIRYIIVERLTLQNTSHALYASRVQHTKVRHCDMTTTSHGYTNSGAGTEFCHAVMDCTVRGDEPWIVSTIGSAQGIEIKGTSAIVAHNYVAGFADGISIDPNSSTSTPPYGSNNNCYDCYGNFVTECGDDAIELDHVVANCRAWRNAVTSCRMGFSNQPLFGGPCYIFRNEIFTMQDAGSNPPVATGSAYKFHNGASGSVLIHNTSSKDAQAFITCMFQNSFFRNNVIMGTTAGLSMFSCGTYNGAPPSPNVTDWDYDAYRANTDSVLVDWFNLQNYTSLVLLAAQRGVESHGILASYAHFVDAIPPAVFDAPSQTINDFDFTLVPGAPEINAGAVLPNINAPFVFDGQPDIGALEYGQGRPKYGPRPIGDVDLDFAVDAADLVAVRNTLTAAVDRNPRSDLLIDGRIDVKDLLFARNRSLGVVGGTLPGTAAGSVQIDLTAADGSKTVRVLPGRTFQVRVMANIQTHNLAALSYRLATDAALDLVGRSYAAPLGYVATAVGAADLPVQLGVWREAAVSGSPAGGDGLGPGAGVLVGTLTFDAPATEPVTLSLGSLDAAYTSQRYPDGQTFEQATVGTPLTVRLRLLGDVDLDDDVDVFDVIDVVIAFGSAPGDPNWNANADFDGNGLIEVFDVIDVINNFGQTK